MYKKDTSFIFRSARPSIEIGGFSLHCSHLVWLIWIIYATADDDRQGLQRLNVKPRWPACC